MHLMISDAAKRAGIHPSTLRRWIRWGVMPPVPRDRNGWRVFREEDIPFLRRLARSRNAQGKS